MEQLEILNTILWLFTTKLFFGGITIQAIYCLIYYYHSVYILWQYSK